MIAVLRDTYTEAPCELTPRNSDATDLPVIHGFLPFFPKRAGSYVKILAALYASINLKKWSWSSSACRKIPKTNMKS